jgi:hypothetical protein
VPVACGLLFLVLELLVFCREDELTFRYISMSNIKTLHKIVKIWCFSIETKPQQLK